MLGFKFERKVDTDGDGKTETVLIIPGWFICSVLVALALIPYIIFVMVK